MSGAGKLHELRHIAVTTWIEQDLPARLVQELASHSDVHIAIQIYSRIRPRLHQTAAETMERLFGHRAGRKGGESGGGSDDQAAI